MLLVITSTLLLLLLAATTMGPAALVASAAAATTSRSSSTNKIKKPSDFLVQGLDEIEPAFAKFPGKMYSGLLPVDHHNDDNDAPGSGAGAAAVKGELMFWLFAPDEPASVENKKTITAWLNGGPGCSSFFAGAFFEHGVVTVPLVRFLLAAGGGLSMNQYARAKQASRLSVQPAHM